MGRGGISLFRFKGIEVLLHWTFLILPALHAFPYIMEGRPLRAMAGIVLILILFFCVLLHEFGHALTAQRYGIRTRSIVLYPIGGVANLERMPHEPRKEFWITLAGPLVNLAIALVTLPVILIAHLPVNWGDWTIVTSWDMLAHNILFGNLTLFLFNLIPAFPMDGGRLLRAALGLRMPRERATRIAATLGQVVAVGFMAYGFYDGRPFLAVIGFFIFAAAGAEMRSAANTPSAPPVEGSVREAMQVDMPLLPGTATVGQGLEEIDRRKDGFLVVLDDQDVRGVVLRSVLERADPEARLATVDAERVPTVSPQERAEGVGRYLLAHNYPAALVLEQGRLVGVVTVEGIARAAKRQA